MYTKGADDLQQHNVSKAMRCRFSPSITSERVQSAGLYTERFTSRHGEPIPSRLNAPDTSWDCSKDGKRLARSLVTLESFSI